MDFFAASKDLLIAVLCVVMAFRLRDPACQFPDFLITLLVMPMLHHFTNEISFIVIAAVFRAVLMLFCLADKSRGYTIAAFVMMVSVALRNVTDQFLGITGIIMLVGFNAAICLFLHCDGGKDKGIGRYKHYQGCNS